MGESLLNLTILLAVMALPLAAAWYVARRYPYTRGTSITSFEQRLAIRARLALAALIGVCLMVAFVVLSDLG